MNREQLILQCRYLIDLLDDDDLTSAIENMKDQLDYKQQREAYEKRIQEGRINYYDGEYYTQEDYDKIRGALK